MTASLTLDPSLRDQEFISRNVKRLEPRALNFRHLREEPTREDIMVTSLALSLRGMVEQGQIPQAEADRQLDEYKQRLQRNPFPLWIQVSMSASECDRDDIIRANPLLEYCRAHGLDFKREGNRFKCRCPLHDDHDPSFCIGPDPNVWYCFGCGRGGSVIDLHAELKNLTIGEAMRELGGDQQQRSHKEIATYVYRDEDGYPLFEVVRFFPKDFRQFKLDEKGERIWKGGMGDTRRVPYRLPELLLSDEVIVVEGEKDVEVLVTQADRVATCNPGGAGKWRAQYAQYFKDRHVFVIPDQDEPGRKHADDVARSLVDIAQSIMLVDLPEGIKDVAELAQANGQIFSEKLSELLKAARPFELPSTTTEDPPDSDEDDSDPPPSQQRSDPALAIVEALRKSELSGSAFRQLRLKPRARLLDDWFREGDSGFIYSRRGVGKTWLSWMIARGIAMGVSVGPWSAGDQAVKVYYLDGEMPAELMQQREIAFGDASDNLILISHEVLFERTGLVLNLRLPEVQRAITDWCIEGGGKVLFIDNLSTLVSGVKENESDAWELLLPWLLDLRRKKIAVVLVHHAGRSGEMRGTSRREDSVFWIIRLEENTNYSGKGCSFVQRFDKNRNSSSNHASYNWTFKPREDYDQQIDVSYEIASLKSQVFDLIVDGLVTCRAIADELKTSTASVSRAAKELAQEGKITVNKRRYRPIDEDV